MNSEELNPELFDALYEKMDTEQNIFRDWLKSQSPEEILSHANEYTVREEILMSMLNYGILSTGKAEALLSSPTPLADVTKEYLNMEDERMDMALNAIFARANYVIQQERDALLTTPVYIQSGVYARDHGELDVFRASYQANVACKDAIEKAISENYADNRLNTTAIYDDVVGRFGTDRVKFVLATTIQHKDWDQRFSRDNRAWAQSVPMEDGFGAREADHSVYYVVNTHSGLTDLFVSHFRKEQAREKEQPKKESVLGKLQKPLPTLPAKDGKDKSHER